MTTKGFLILVGENTAKNELQERLKKDYWVWNVSTLNHLRHNAGALGWEFRNDGVADEFIQRLLDLSNELLDYEYNYVVKFVEKIKESKKAQENGKKGDLLIAHVNKDLADRLQDEFDFHVLSVSMTNVVEDNFRDGRFVLGLDDTEEKVNKAIESIFSIICTEKNKQGE
jgi:hypothetical protein